MPALIGMAYRIRTQIQPQAETRDLTQTHGQQAEPVPCPGDSSGSGQEGGLLWEGKHSPIRAAQHTEAGSSTHPQAGIPPPQHCQESCCPERAMLGAEHTLAR